MSRRAYRIIEIRMAEEASFNLLEDKKLVSFLDREGDLMGALDSDSGPVDVPLEALEVALEQSDKLCLTEDIIKRLRKDIMMAKRRKDESVLYYCF